MGFIKAFTGALSGTFADQWKDFFVPRAGVPATAAISIAAAVSAATAVSAAARRPDPEEVILHRRPLDRRQNHVLRPRGVPAAYRYRMPLLLDR